MRDFGIKLYLTHDGSGIYFDAEGETGSAGTIGAIPVYSEPFSLEAQHRGAVAVHIDRAGGGIGDVDMVIEGRVIDGRNPGIFDWAPLLSSRSDGATPAVYEHTLTAAQGADVFLYPVDFQLVGQLRVGASAAIAPVSGDRIVCRVVGETTEE